MNINFTDQFRIPKPKEILQLLVSLAVFVYVLHNGSYSVWVCGFAGVNVGQSLDIFIARRSE